MTRSRIVLLLLLVGLITGAGAPRKDSNYPRVFTGDFDQARVQAQERNAVIVIAVIQQKEETNDDFRTEVWQRTEFRNATESAIAMIVNDGEHRQTKITETLPNGEKVERSVCSYFHTERCAVHKRLWNVAYQEFSDGEDMPTPQLIVLLPDGTEFGRLIDNHVLKQNLAMVAAAQAKAGPSLSVRALGIVKTQRKLASDHAVAGRHAGAWHAWQKVLEQTQTGNWATEATAGIVAAEAGYHEDVADADARLEQGEVIDAWSRLVALGEDWTGSPFEKAHRKLVKKVEKDKRYKEVIAKEKLERESAQLWEECVALIAKGKEKPALKIARRIVRKFAGTKAAASALAEFPELEAARK